MIIISFLWTFQLIASLIDQVLKKPVVFYRDDTPIDVTQVKINMNNKKLNFDLNQTQIPFPAFTICALGNSTIDDSVLDFSWMEIFTLPTFLISTEFGICKSVNFCDRKMFFSSEVDEKQISEYSPSKYPQYTKTPENQTQPYKTTSLEFGFFARVLHRKNLNQLEKIFTNPILLMIHSPFELPTKKSRQFTMVDMNFDNFIVTPQVEKIDDSMINMEPHE